MHIDSRLFSGACACSHTHNVFTRDVRIARGAVASLPALLSGYGFHAPCVICDSNTYLAAGRQVHAMLQGNLVCLPADGLHADECAVEGAQSRLPDGVDLLVAVGAGTVHDVTRFCAHARGIPFLSVPTAASVDGFSSTVAAMTWKGLKKSFTAVAPFAVVADTDIFKNAPYRLTASGISDLMGKYIAIADWRIAHIVTGEYICERVCAMALEAVETTRSCLSRLRAGDDTAYENLMYGLLISGLAMQMVGNSRPASGAEHHLSHLWEMEVLNPHIDALHGEKVSVGLMHCVYLYQRAKQDIRAGRCNAIYYAGLEQGLLREAFPQEDRYQGILEENRPDPLLGIDPSELEAALPAIVQVLDQLPSAQQLDALLAQGGCTRSMADIGLHDNLIEKSICLSPYVRNRVTFLRLMKMLQFA